MARYQKLRGTRDILPGEVERWQRVEETARRIISSYGFREIRTPMLEATDLFVRSVGDSTDIVKKEMYTFTMGGDSMTLRPEGTAPVVRAFIEGGLDRIAGSDRLYYIGPMFRYERPQKGRQRQFHQIGVEVIGSEEPAVDAETIEMLLRFLDTLGITGTTLVLNSVGDRVCRPVYREALVGWLTPRLDRMCADCRRRSVENPMRVFDCKVENCRRLLEEAPSIAEHLCEPCREHFAAVRELIDAYGIGYRIDTRLVRGLDYYVRTAFEVLAEGLGAQNSLMGGGRYDGLVSDLGGRETPAFGWALGMERLLMILPETAGTGNAGPDFMVAPVGREAAKAAAIAARALRVAAMSAVLESSARSLQSHLRKADKLGARRVLIIGESEIRTGIYLVRDMRSGEQTEIAAGDLASLAARPA